MRNVQDLINNIEGSNKPALISPNVQYTYAELISTVDNIANNLTVKLNKPNSIIILNIDDNEMLLIYMLAIMKAGMTYVPIQPDTPQEKFEKLISVVNPDLIINNSNTNEFICKPKKKVKLRKAKDDDIAALYLTSGSTGESKCVIRTYLNMPPSTFFVNNHNQNIAHKNEYKSCLILFNYHFVASIIEILTCILNNKQIVILTLNDLYNMSSSTNFLENISPLRIASTPSILYSIAHSEKINKVLNNVNNVLLGGESTNPTELKFISEKFPHIIVESQYGSTEGGIGAEGIVSNNNEKSCGYISGDEAITIIDENNKSIEIGKTGRIVVKGHSVSPGYYNDPKTNDLFYKEKGINCFKTSDMGYITEDRKLVIIGRIDKVVKINGIRVNLNEIENAIEQFESINKCACKTTLINSKERIVVFYTSKKDIIEEELTTFLKEKLNRSLIPSYYVKLETFPLNNNGKNDYSKLDFVPETDPDFNSNNKSINIICDIMRKTLNTNINPNSNFFQCGGDSLSAIRLICEINSYGYNLEIDDLYTHSSPNKLASLLNSKKKQNIEEIELRDNKKYLIHDSHIKYLYDFLSTDTDRWHVHWNSTIITISKGWTKDQFESILMRIINNHPAFKSEFIKENEDYYQIISDTPKVKLYYFDSSKETKHNKLNELDCFEFDFAKPNFVDKIKYATKKKKFFNGDNKTLAYIGCERTSQNESQIYIRISHVISDWDSLNHILFQEIDNEGKDLLPDNFSLYNEHLNNEFYAIPNSKSKKADLFYESYLNKANLVMPRSKKYLQKLTNVSIEFNYKINFDLINKIREKIADKNITITEYEMYVIWKSWAKVFNTSDIVLWTHKNKPINNINYCDNVFGYNSILVPVVYKTSMSLNDFIENARKSFSYSFWNKQLYYPLCNFLISDNNNYKIIKKINNDPVKNRRDGIISYNTGTEINIVARCNIFKNYATDYYKLIRNIRKEIKNLLKE